MLFVQKYPNYQVYNLDALTYAGNLENLKDIENASNYKLDSLGEVLAVEVFDDSLKNNYLSIFNFLYQEPITRNQQPFLRKNPLRKTEKRLSCVFCCVDTLYPSSIGCCPIVKPLVLFIKHFNSLVLAAMGKVQSVHKSGITATICF